MSKRLKFALACLACGWAFPAPANDLFHPVPSAQMRELSTDRPDKTESPVTVDAGHWQFETDLISFHREQADGLRSDAWAVDAFNLKAGLLDNMDLQLVFEPIDGQRTEDLASGETHSVQGQGDLLFRLKIHLYDGQGLIPTFGLMPFIKSPTAAEGLGNGVSEAGLILPFGWDLPAGFSLGCMAEFDQALNSTGSGSHIDSIASASLSHGLFGSVEGYVELWTQISGEGGVEGQSTLDGGLTWEVVPNVQLDAGVNAGLTAASEDLNPFAGLSLRH